VPLLLELDSDPDDDDDAEDADDAEELPEPIVVGLGQSFSPSSVHAAAPKTKPPTTSDARTNFCIAVPRNRTPNFLCN
jgi:hypothetical protein